MGIYIREIDVEDRVRGKVRFTDDPDSEDKMSRRLLRRLIAEAEGQVELDLSPRYAAPFQTRDGQPFSSLPERPTKEYIRTMCELQAVLRVLETDFGTGAINSEDYVKKTQERYTSMVDRLIKLRMDDYQNQWLYPPLPSLRLNTHNTEADDGFRGMVINTSEGIDYASQQINDPSLTWWNVSWDDIYGKDIR